MYLVFIVVYSSFVAGATVVLYSLWLSVVTFDITCVNMHVYINGLKTNNQIEDYPLLYYARYTGCP